MKKYSKKSLFIVFLFVLCSMGLSKEVHAINVIIKSVTVDCSLDINGVVEFDRKLPATAVTIDFLPPNNGPAVRLVTNLPLQTDGSYQWNGKVPGYLSIPKGSQLKVTTNRQVNSTASIPVCIMAVEGFSGVFAPANWVSGSNAPAGVNLVNTSAAPDRITLSNYAPWAVSGTTFVFSKAPLDGTVSFSYKITGRTSDCPGSYAINKKVTILPKEGNFATFTVTAGDSFGFALNGQNLPDNFGCKCNGTSVTFTISNFVFTESR